MQISRRRRHEGPTPLADLAHQSGLVLTTREALGRTIVDVAFDEFIFGHDVLSTATSVGPRSGLERGNRVDGVTLTVGSAPIPQLGAEWLAAQSNRGENHLQLDAVTDDAVEPIGHQQFDDTFTVDADSADVARSVLNDDLCDWLIAADAEHGPLIVLIDAGDDRHGGADDACEGGDSEGDDGGDSDADHRPSQATLYLARLTTDDDEFVATLSVLTELVDALHSAIEA